MGTKRVPSYANLFMTKFEEKYTHILYNPNYGKGSQMTFAYLATWNGFTLGIHKPFK